MSVEIKRESNPCAITLMNLYTQIDRKVHIFCKIHKLLGVLFVWMQLTSNNLCTMQIFTLISGQYSNSQFEWLLWCCNTFQSWAEVYDIVS